MTPLWKLYVLIVLTLKHCLSLVKLTVLNIPSIKVNTDMIGRHNRLSQCLIKGISGDWEISAQPGLMIPCALAEIRYHNTIYRIALDKIFSRTFINVLMWNICQRFFKYLSNHWILETVPNNLFHISLLRRIIVHEIEVYPHLITDLDEPCECTL